MTISSLAPQLAPPTAPTPRANPAAHSPSTAESRQAGAQFEAILVRQLLGPSLTSMLGSDGGAAANVYGDILTETFARQLTAGSGLGLGSMIAAQLGPQQAAGKVEPTSPPKP